MSNVDVALPFVDPHDLVSFWRRSYLEEYVAQGGSSVRWLTGREGAGKTHVLSALMADAQRQGFHVAQVRADEVNLGRFDELYQRMMAQVPQALVARQVARAGARAVGAHTWDPARDHISLKRHFTSQGRPSAAAEDDALRCLDFLYRDANMEPPVASALRRVALPLLLDEDEGLRRAADDAWLWLTGGKMSAAARQRSGIFLTFDRYSARDVFRSFLRGLQLAKVPGFLWTVDNLEALVAPRVRFAPDIAALERDADAQAVRAPAVNYTKMRRTDAYEGIRELIDEGGRLPGFMVVYAGRPEVFSDEKFGLVTYPALAMRIQNEIVTEQVNLLNDVQDLDRLWATDWPRYANALVAAYDPQRTAEALAEVLEQESAAAAVSPVKRLVRLITGQPQRAGLPTYQSQRGTEGAATGMARQPDEANRQGEEGEPYGE